MKNKLIQKHRGVNSVHQNNLNFRNDTGCYGGSAKQTEWIYFLHRVTFTSDSVCVVTHHCRHCDCTTDQLHLPGVVSDLLESL